MLKGGGGNDQIFATPDDLTAIYGGSGIDHLIMDGRNLVSGLEIGTGASSTFSDIELVSGSLTGFDDTVKISVGQNTVDLYSGYSVDAKAGEDHLILRLAGAEDEFDSISMDGDRVVYLDGRNQSLLGYIGFETFDIVGSDLNETLRGGRLADIINGGHGDDVLFGVNGNDTLLGGGGNDLLEGAANGGAVLMQGGDGNDRLELSGNLALLAYGGAGNDSLEGNLRHVKVWGDGGDDQITAAGELYGGKGDDRLLTFGDDSFLFGGLGNDRLDGGGSNNTFMFEGNSATGKDTIGAIDADDAIYIGGGVLFDDLVFTVQGFDLLVEWDMGSVLIYSGATMNITFFTDQPASNQAANQIVTQSTMDTLL